MADPTARQAVVVWGAEPVSTDEAPGCGGESSAFGASVSLAPGTLLVGAPAACDEGVAAGALVIFDRLGERWVESGVIRRTDAEDGARFGAASVFSGTVVAVGAPGAEGDGRIELLERAGWFFYAEATLGPPSGAPPADGPSGFGEVLALHAGTLVAGAPFASPGASEGGAVYVYVDDGETWASSQILRQEPSSAGARFGRLVAVEENDLVVATTSALHFYARDTAETEFLSAGTLPISDARALSLQGGALAVVRGGGVVELYGREASGEGWTLRSSLSLPGAALGPMSIVAGQLVVATDVGAASFLQAPGSTTLLEGWTDDGLVEGGTAAATAVAAGDGMVVLGDGAGGVTSYRRVASNGEACADGKQCLSGFCVDGVCCESGCGGGEVDCLACSVAAGSTEDGQCEVATAGATCRPSIGGCDRAEVCDGFGDACPTDIWLPENTLCRPAAGSCDVPETCGGASPFCPVDDFVDVGVVCRASHGACDLVEVCDGVRARCPTDARKVAGTECRSRVDVCDVKETCDGASAACPDDGFKAFGVVCRAPTGPCDAEERCTGRDGACPANAYAPDGTGCIDGDACTEGDQCVRGSCVSGPDVCESPEPEPVEEGDGGPEPGPDASVHVPKPGATGSEGCSCAAAPAAPTKLGPTKLAGLLLLPLLVSLVRRRRS